MCFERENSLGKIGSVAFCSVFVTLHRILMLKVKARAQHAFTLKQNTNTRTKLQLGVHFQSAAVGGVLMNEMADGSPDEKRQSK